MKPVRSFLLVIFARQFTAWLVLHCVLQAILPVAPAQTLDAGVRSSEVATAGISEGWMLMANEDWQAAKSVFERTKSINDNQRQAVITICNHGLGETLSRSPRSTLRQVEKAFVSLIADYQAISPLSPPPPQQWLPDFNGETDPRRERIAFADREFATRQIVGQVFNGRIVFTPDDNKLLDQLEADRKAMEKRISVWESHQRKPNNIESQLLEQSSDLERVEGIWIAKFMESQEGKLSDSSDVAVIEGSSIRLFRENRVILHGELSMQRERVQIDNRYGLTGWWGKLNMSLIPLIETTQHANWYRYVSPLKPSDVEMLCLRIGPAPDEPSDRYTHQKLELVLFRDASMRRLGDPLLNFLEERRSDVLAGKWQLVDYNETPLRGDQRVDFEITKTTVRKALVERNAPADAPSTHLVVQPYELRVVSKPDEKTFGEIDWGKEDEEQKGIFQIQDGSLWINMARRGKPRPSQFQIDEDASDLMLFQNSLETGSPTTWNPPKYGETSASSKQTTVMLATGSQWVGQITRDDGPVVMKLNVLSREGKSFTGTTHYSFGSAKFRGTLTGTRVEFDEYQSLSGQVVVPCHFDGELSNGRLSGTWSARRSRSNFTLDLTEQ